VYELSIGSKIADLEWPWMTLKWPLFCVISPNSVSVGAHCVKVYAMVEDRRKKVKSLSCLLMSFLYKRSPGRSKWRCICRFPFTGSHAQFRSFCSADIIIIHLLWPWVTFYALLTFHLPMRDYGQKWR